MSQSQCGGPPSQAPYPCRLGALLPHQLPDGSQPPLQAGFPFSPDYLLIGSLSGISIPFGTLFRTRRQVSYVLLTRAPLSPK